MANQKLRYNFFKWKYLFLTVVSLWFCSLIAFFANPKGTQQWITKMVEGDVESISIVQSPEVCTVHYTHAWRMNDQLKTYWLESHSEGLEKEPRRTSDISKFVDEGDLVAIESNDLFFVDTMFYSYPFAKQKVKKFIQQLSLRFQLKLMQTDLYGTKMVVTSLLRTKNSVSRLMRKNKNAVKHSSHLHGTTFDISYQSFIHNRELTDGEIAHLKETLAETLFEMRTEQRCYVTYEYFQTCFHVVCR